MKTLLTLFTTWGTLFCINAVAQTKKGELLPAGSTCCINKNSEIKTHKNTYTMKNEATINSRKTVACKLTSPELQKRKAEVLAFLKKKVLKKEELENGYQYTFEGSDEMLEELMQFIKTERACCNFFSFQLLVTDDESPVILTISGPDGAKEFITAEMDL